MNGVLAMVAATALAIDVGWEPLPNGGFEYIIQIEPQTLESMKRGQDIFSQLPAAVRGMARYRITVGDGAVPHEGEALPVEAMPSAGDRPAGQPKRRRTRPQTQLLHRLFPRCRGLTCTRHQQRFLPKQDHRSRPMRLRKPSPAVTLRAAPPREPSTRGGPSGQSLARCRRHRRSPGRRRPLAWSRLC